MIPSVLYDTVLLVSWCILCILYPQVLGPMLSTEITGWGEWIVEKASTVVCIKVFNAFLLVMSCHDWWMPWNKKKMMKAFNKVRLWHYRSGQVRSFQVVWQSLCIPSPWILVLSTQILFFKCRTPFCWAVLAFLHIFYMILLRGAWLW